MTEDAARDESDGSGLAFGDYEIRPATEADAPTLLRLLKNLAEYERLADKVVATADDLARALAGPNPAVEAAVAWQGREPAGFVLWYRTFSTFRGREGVYVEDLFVEESHRGQGLGGALLRHVAAAGRARGAFRLEWEVLRWNEPAIRFYERLGGRPEDDWAVYTLAGDAFERLASARTP